MDELTPFQRIVIEQLYLVGMEDFADRAREAWTNLRPYPCTLTAAERATMEGAGLCTGFKTANQQARAAYAEQQAQPQESRS